MVVAAVAHAVKVVKSVGKNRIWDGGDISIWGEEILDNEVGWGRC